MSNVLATNKTLSSIIVSAWTVYYINSSNAELVTVYNTNNNPYDCFKYLFNNISWFYVLDGIQNSWVNDLSVIGYSLTPPAPTLPTVTYLSTIYGLLSTASIASEGTSSPLKAKIGGVYDGDYFTKDNSKQYAFFRYNDGLGYKDAGGIFEVAWSQENYLCAKNVTDGAEDLESVRIAECSSANAQAIIVYDIEYGYATNAFKFNLNGTYYYSVLSGMFGPGEWTDDLSSEGYTEDSPKSPVSLPTVLKRSDIYSSPDSWNHQIGSGSEEVVFERVDGSYRGILYDDTTMKQCIYGWMYYTSGMSGWERHYYGVSAVNMSGNSLGVRNDTQNTINVTYLLYATCSSSQATVITVYDSSNVAYNAFKYTANNTDYYYILDGTQTDWTDDLSSIGYTEDPPAPTEFIGYVSYSKTDNYQIQRGQTGALRDDNADYIPFDNSKTYEFIALKMADGTDSSLGAGGVGFIMEKYEGSSGPFVSFSWNGGSALTIGNHVVYKMS